MDDVIIGLDLLQSTRGVILDLDSVVLRLGNEELVLFANSNVNTVVKIVLEEDTTLPPVSEFVVSVVVDGISLNDPIGVIEPVTQRKGVLVARTLVNARGKVTFARIANFCDY